MRDLKILRYPDPLLAKACAPVVVFDAELTAFAEALYAAMKRAPGIGITAGHVGKPIRLVILDLPELGGRRDFVNPEIIASSTETVSYEEGSVSMPGAIETITRPKSISLRYRDLKGSEHTIALRDFAAVCMQHEVDQLDGIFWIERLSRLKRDRLVRRWKKVAD